MSVTIQYSKSTRTTYFESSSDLPGNMINISLGRTGELLSTYSFKMDSVQLYLPKAIEAAAFREFKTFGQQSD